jgi:chromosome segregation and condensation protein ScpB
MDKRSVAVCNVSTVGDFTIKAPIFAFMAALAKKRSMKPFSQTRVTTIAKTFNATT